ncbi:cell surface hydrolase [Lactiplantibacillus xiangfangensis]|uniref:Cell surface hydrolase n=2 Tax=Lactiplantibacillus xiangfangensis TaxID=942150 RepID=A0A0R2MCM6_9LACO|nr:cell surface hydrolase [Lactiplantibacillus xiangfangensis]
MFKYGKHWVYAGITLASVGTTLLMTTNAQAADTNNGSDAPTAAIAAQPTVATEDMDEAANGAAAPAGTENKETNNEQSLQDQPTGLPGNNDTNGQTNGDNAGSGDSSQSSQGSDATQSDTAGSTVNSGTSDGSEGTPSDTSDAQSVDSSADSHVTSNAISDDSKQRAAETPTLDKKESISPVLSDARLAEDASHGPVYTTDDKTLDHQGKITIEQTGPYAITWKEVSTTNQTETKTVTLDASDFVNLIKTINDTTGNTDKLAAAKAKYEEMVAQLKALPSKVASQLVGNLLYQMVFTGTGSQALSNFRTALDPTRYDISNTWTGLDPVAYAADREAAETYYPAAVTWYNNVAKETWSLPEYNDPTQNVRATYIQNGDSTKTVVIGQGWTERPDWIGYVSKIWYDMGYNILMPSQRGQFLSDGNDMTFGYQDKYDWLNWVRLVDERNGKNSEVVFYGQSLGADTVIEAASVQGLSKSVKAVIADAGYATLPELGSSLYNKAVAAISSKLTSIGLPAITSIPFLSYDQVLAVINNRLMKQQGFSVDDISGVSAASKVTVPLMLIHTEDDAFIPYTQSLELAAANNSKIKTVWILPGEVGGHAGANNAVLQYTQHIKDFLAEATATATDVDTGEAVDPEDAEIITPTPEPTTDTADQDDNVIDSGTTTVDPEDELLEQPTTDSNAGQNTHLDSTDNAKGQTTLNQAKPEDVDQTNPVTLDPTATKTDSKAVSENDTQAANNVNLKVLTATTDSPVSAVSLAAATTVTPKPVLTLNANDLIDEDQSGSVVTASLKHDDSTQASASSFTIASVPTHTADMTNTTDATDTTNATPTQLVDHSVASEAPAAAQADTLPQTSDKPQTWIAALGASLAALATGLWASLRRRFNR